MFFLYFYKQRTNTHTHTEHKQIQAYEKENINNTLKKNKYIDSLFFFYASQTFCDTTYYTQQPHKTNLTGFNKFNKMQNTQRKIIKHHFKTLKPTLKTQHTTHNNNTIQQNK